MPERIANNLIFLSIDVINLHLSFFTKKNNGKLKTVKVLKEGIGLNAVHENALFHSNIQRHVNSFIIIIIKNTHIK